MVKRGCRNFNENEFQETIYNLDWVSIVDIKSKDPNHLINNFFNNVTYLLDGFASNKKVTKRESKLNYKPNSPTMPRKPLNSISKENDPALRKIHRPPAMVSGCVRSLY